MATTTPLARSKHELRGFLLILLRMAATSSLPPPSLASVRWGCVLVYSTGTTTTATTSPLTCSKRELRGFLLITQDSRHIIATTPLTCKCEVGVFSHLFYWDDITAATPSHLQSEMGVGFPSFHSRQPPHHHHHPLSLANTR